MSNEDRYVFVAECYDHQSSLVKTYYIEYYLSDKTIDIYDLKARKMFLKRTRYNITGDDLYLGATVTIYSR